MLLLFFKSIIVGFIIGIPTGPVGVLCVRRTISHGRAAGLISGLGSTSADLVYAAIVIFGLQSVAQIFLHYHTPLRLGGGVFLLYLGFTTFFSRPLVTAPTNNPRSQWKNFSSAFILTITNPVIIFSFTALFAAYGLAGEHGHITAAGLSLTGIFIGSIFWWLFMTSLVRKFRHRISEHWMSWVNRVSGIIIFAFGVIALVLLK
jgi:threonine/homoserine/homoserine lactone efflux protein